MSDQRAGWVYPGARSGRPASTDPLRLAAPVHNAIYLKGIRAFHEALPGAVLAAAFETEFHSTMPEYAARYGVPGACERDDEVRRYGFHGASHQYVAGKAPSPRPSH